MTDYKSLQAYYENCLSEHGPNNNGVDWGNQADLVTRYHVMSELFKHEKEKVSVLDIGCGPGLYLDFLKGTSDLPEIEYTGIDISDEMVKEARLRHPEATFAQHDFMKAPLEGKKYDYAVINGVFTVKGDIPQADMVTFYHTLLLRVFQATSKGVAVNFMTKYVDWEKDRLFHLAIDDFCEFAVEKLARHIVIRHDYGLWEYTAYVRHNPLSMGNEAERCAIMETIGAS